MAEGFDEIEMGEYEELEDVVQDLRKDVIDMYDCGTTDLDIYDTNERLQHVSSIRVEKFGQRLFRHPIRFCKIDTIISFIHRG